MADYQIRLFKADGTPSIIIAVAALGVTDAKLQAAAMLKDEISSAQIWEDQNCVAVILARTEKPKTLTPPDAANSPSTDAKPNA